MAVPAAVAVGDEAPDFTLPGTGGRQHTLSEHRGRPLVLAFYPGDGTRVCTTQLRSYNDGIERFDGLGAQLLAISPQGIESHEDFSCRHGFAFPLLADVDKAVFRLYGCLGPLGFPRRSIFVVDPGGTVRYAHRALAGATFKSTDTIVEAVRRSL